MELLVNREFTAARVAQSCSAGRQDSHYEHYEGKKSEVTSVSTSRGDLHSHLQREGPNAPMNELDENGCSPLMYAALADSVPVVEMLLNFAAKREIVRP